MNNGYNPQNKQARSLAKLVESTTLFGHVSSPCPWKWSRAPLPPTRLQIPAPPRTRCQVPRCSLQKQPAKSEKICVWKWQLSKKSSRKKHGCQCLSHPNSKNMNEKPNSKNLTNRILKKSGNRIWKNATFYEKSIFLLIEYFPEFFSNIFS